MVETTEINGMSIPPIKDYNIVPTVWNTPVNVTVGELLANPTTIMNYSPQSIQ